jgi:plastocyanin
LFRKLLVVGVVLSVAGFMVACGGGDEKKAALSGGGASGAIEVELVDLAFKPDSLSATAGKELTLHLKNSGAQPHTFTITGVVDSQRIEPGQSKTVSFTPGQAGTLTFFCTVHGQGTMSGKLSVN